MAEELSYYGTITPERFGLAWLYDFFGPDTNKFLQHVLEENHEGRLVRVRITVLEEE